MSLGTQCESDFGQNFVNPLTNLHKPLLTSWGLLESLSILNPCQTSESLFPFSRCLVALVKDFSSLWGRTFWLTVKLITILSRSFLSGTGLSLQLRGSEIANWLKSGSWAKILLLQSNVAFLSFAQEFFCLYRLNKKCRRLLIYFLPGNIMMDQPVPKIHLSHVTIKITFLVLPIWVRPIRTLLCLCFPLP